MNESESVQPTDAVLEPDDAGDAASIEELTAELERTRAAYQRAMADYQNLQRRSR